MVQNMGQKLPLKMMHIFIEMLIKYLSGTELKKKKKKNKKNKKPGPRMAFLYTDPIPQGTGKIPASLILLLMSRALA
jgi:hypothetical protein